MSLRLRDRQIKAAFKLVEPMGEMLEMTGRCLDAHHPEGVDRGDCPICMRFMDEMMEILRRWEDAKAQVTEHWDIDLAESD